MQQVNKKNATKQQKGIDKFVFVAYNGNINELQCNGGVNMPENNTPIWQELVVKIADMSHVDAEIMSLMIASYLCGKAAAEQKAS